MTGKYGTEIPGPIAPPGVTTPQYPGQIVPADQTAAKPVQPAAAPQVPAAQPAPASPGPVGWDRIRAGIFKGESGGDPNTLYDHVERSGPFAGVKLTDMTVDQALAFNSPTGPYGQWARSKGISAAPMGSYQIVHRTLQMVKDGMGLSGNEKMTPALQEKMGQYIYSKQGTGAWAGYRGPADPNSVKPVNDYGPQNNAMNRPAGSEWQPPTDYSDSFGTGIALGPDTNTALATQAGRRGSYGGGGGGSVAEAQAPGGGGAHQNSVSPDYKRYQARKNIAHLRGLSPVATIQALANIGKGLRAEGGGKSA